MTKALRWQQRRGMKELDVLLERYYNRHYMVAAPAERAVFAKLLQHEDTEIWLWVVGQAEVPAEFEHVIATLRQHD